MRMSRRHVSVMICQIVFCQLIEMNLSSVKHLISASKLLYCRVLASVSYLYVMVSGGSRDFNQLTTSDHTIVTITLAGIISHIIASSSSRSK